MGTKPAEWYLENECELCEPTIMVFLAVYHLTNGDPCKDCYSKNTCKTFKLINHPSSRSHPKRRVETNADVACRMGVSKRQVAKMRREGTLEEG